MSAWKEWVMYEKKAIEAKQNGNKEEAEKYERMAEEAKIAFEYECEHDY